jgi:hypothetical protein
MVTGIMKCRVCGKEYEVCRNIKRVDGVFRWQSVACSPEHGAEYLALIRASRAKADITEEFDRRDEAYTLFDAEYGETEAEHQDFDDDSDEEIEIEV